MLFFSYDFLFVFFPIVFCIAYFTIKQRTIYLVFLSAASLIFYMIWRFNDIYIFITSICINYILGGHLYTNKNKFLLGLGICFNLSLLVWFKYAFYVNNLFNFGFSIPQLVLPLAISFYTFEQITYIVDSYKGIMVRHNFLDYVFLISFFPRLIAGPIIQPAIMLQQIKEDISFNKKNYAIGLTLFIVGMFKKVVIADYFSFFVDESYSLYNSPSYSLDFIETWSSSIAYAFQIYFDFSGYSDMAIGLALFFGIRLPINFDSPYKSKSIIEFWRRWHISLSGFLRDYLYIPLGGNQRGELRKYFNLFIVMCLGGIWHGANLTFFVWGCFHGFLLIINNLWIPWRTKIDLNTKSLTYQISSWLVTFCAVCIGWVYFRSENIHTANKIILAMFGKTSAHNNDISHQFGLTFYLITLITFLFCYSFPNTLNWVKYSFGRDRNQLTGTSLMYDICVWKPNFMHALFIAIIFAYCLLMLFPLDSKPPFIYFNF